MSSIQKVEQYLQNMDLLFEREGENRWVINDAEKSLYHVFIIVDDPVIFFHVNLMPLPREGRTELYELLLQLNAGELLFGSYGIEKDKVVMVDTLVSETMDYEEFRYTLESFGMAMSEHYKKLSKYRDT